MPGKRTISEDEFLSVINCPRFYTLSYNPYQMDRSQSIALNSLKIFYQNLNKLYKGLDMDELIKLSVSKSIGQKLQHELQAYKKSIKIYSYMFIYDFIKRYPLEDWDPILIDVKLPVEPSGFLINFNYDFILKSKKTLKLLVINFIHKFDYQIKNNLDYFESKAFLFYSKVHKALAAPKIEFMWFYFPKYKHSSLKKRDSLLFIPIQFSKKSNIDFYINIFLNKFKLERNPFCLNYSCQVRKQCYDDK